MKVHDVYSCVCVCRNARGQGALRELLNPLVRSVIDDASLQINTNPVEVYKQWINQTEAETGQTRYAIISPAVLITNSFVVDDVMTLLKCHLWCHDSVAVSLMMSWLLKCRCHVSMCCSHLPYDVTPELALQHEPVRDRIKHSMQCLQDTTEYFLSAILESVDKIPYVSAHVHLAACFICSVIVLCVIFIWYYRLFGCNNSLSAALFGNIEHWQLLAVNAS